MGVIFIKSLYWFFYFITSFILVYEILIFFLSKLAKQKKNEEKNNTLYKYLILIPAYKESETLYLTINAIKKLNYPTDLYMVILIADNCDESLLNKIEKEIKVLRLNLKTHSKVESLKQAIPYVSNFDFVLVLDSDNLIHPEFLNALNRFIKPQSKVIQGIRLPKSINNIYESLDSITDFIYNQLDRLIPSSLGLTGTLSGSGFAVNAKLFGEVISKIETLGGFDKILQSKLILDRIPIEICKDAIIYDEKVYNSKNYVIQRRRWLYYHFYNAIKFGFTLTLKGLLNFDANQIHLGLVSLRPPLNLLYLIVFVLLIAGFFININLSIILLVITLIFSLILLSILLKEKILSFQLILNLPRIFYFQMKSMLRIMDAKKNSLRTEHISVTSIDKILNNEQMEK